LTRKDVKMVISYGKEVIVYIGSITEQKIERSLRDYVSDVNETRKKPVENDSKKKADASDVRDQLRIIKRNARAVYGSTRIITCMAPQK